jgi:carbamoyltransferase
MSLWIAGITRGHNGGICLLKDGEIVFNTEEERFSRMKYDGGPLAGMVKILDYTDKIDYLVVAHTQPLDSKMTPSIDFTGDNVYTGLARKLGLIDRGPNINIMDHPQVIDLSQQHHKLHAAAAFYRSGFEKAVAVIVDGAGTFLNLTLQGETNTGFELESIFTCEYPAKFKTIYRHVGGNGPWLSAYIPNMESESIKGESGTHECIIDDYAGIVKAYEAVTQYCGFNAIEAGKTMGLFPYGRPNDSIPPIFHDNGGTARWKSADKSLIIPTYPNGALVNEGRFDSLATPEGYGQSGNDLTLLQSRRDMAYAIQTQSQEMVVELIKKAVSDTGINNVVVSGGYGLNCVANYHYLEALKDDNINLYVEPVSSDAGTAMGAAIAMHYMITNDTTVRNFGESLYLGPEYNYTTDDVDLLVEKYNAEVYNITPTEVVNIMRKKNIVAMFQGRAEAGPRALGNRSLMFDPTFEDGKDFVNRIKRREYFRPFAGSIMHEFAHDWFDMRGMEESPHMMYAMNCQPGVAEKIPSIIHIDETCRIQTVKEYQNPFYYEIINEFYKQTEIPIIFNTSFNLGGEPLVETLDDAFRTLANSEIEYLYMPELKILVKIKNDT